MKIVLTSPLYPPDTAEPARYAKDLAGRLAENHDVTALVYAGIPETVPGVMTQVIDKKLPRPVRVLLYTAALVYAARGASCVIAINGPSVELPLLVASLVTSARIQLIVADQPADTRSQADVFERMVRHHLRSRVTVHENVPLPRPEILPFAEYPEEAFGAYETSWKEHLASLSV